MKLPRVTIRMYRSAARGAPRERAAGWLLALVMLATGAALAAPAAPAVESGVPPAPRFTDEGEVAASEGHATLTWTIDADRRSAPVFELQQSRSPEFANHRVIHEGVEDSYFVSGLLQGPTYFRVRVVRDGGLAGPWSRPLAVRVSYPGRTRVVVLLVAGFIVLVATVGAIVTGHLRSRA